MQRVRSVVADALVGVVLLLVAFWLLRRVFQMDIWGSSIVLMVILVVVVFRIASKIRG